MIIFTTAMQISAAQRLAAGDAAPYSALQPPPPAKQVGFGSTLCVADSCNMHAHVVVQTAQAPRIRRCVTANAKQGDNGAAASSSNPLEFNELTDIIR